MIKLNLIGMILNNAGRRCFEGAILDDADKPLPAADSLHVMIMEYAKIMNGGTSEIVTVSPEVLSSEVRSHTWRKIMNTQQLDELLKQMRDLIDMFKKSC